MKTKAFTTFAALLLVAGIETSCESCNKKNEVSDDAGTSYTKSEDVSADTAVVADQNNATPTTANVSSGKTKKTATGGGHYKTGKGKSKDGFSAADGTDAENNDGDQYTKNDNKPMPSGPPIK